MKLSRAHKIEGLLVGTAVGDAIGLPMEGMRPARIAKLGWTGEAKLRHRFFFGRGMWSDDTEQTIMIAQALLACEGDEKKFARLFAWELRWWLFGMPAATGLATARAILKLWMGFEPGKSGVFSAGNGCAMRAAPIAAMFPDDPETRRVFAEAQTRVTHSDPKAAIATLAVVELAALFLNAESVPSKEAVIAVLVGVSLDSEWVGIVRLIESSGGIEDLLPKLGGRVEKGVSGYVYQTVPAVIAAGILHDWDFESTVTEIIAAGGDTDTTAAIAGALCGACGGVRGIPKDWIDGIREWPVSVKKLSALADGIFEKRVIRIRARWSPFLLLRNVCFLGVVLGHGLVRLVR